MTDNIDTLLNGGVFDPEECISSEEIAKELGQSLACSQCRECNVKLLHKMDCSSKELPLLNSQHKEYQDKIRQIQEDLRLSQTVILHGVTRIINENTELTPEIKQALLKEIWK